MSVDWVGLLQTFGLAVVLLFFLGWSAVGVARWLGPRLDRMFERLFSASDGMADLGRRVTTLEARVESLWTFLLRRGVAEAVTRGVGSMNSPLTISDEAKAWFAPFAHELHEFYRGGGGGSLPDDRLAEEIERRWGERMLREVCLPHGMSQGACLLIAMAVAREAETAAEEREAETAAAAAEEEERKRRKTSS